jgi:hypothetical protein
MGHDLAQRRTCALTITVDHGRRRSPTKARRRVPEGWRRAIYVEAPTSEKQLEQIGKAFKGVPQMTNMFEGVTPAEHESIVDLPAWAAIEQRFGASSIPLDAADNQR